MVDDIGDVEATATHPAVTRLGVMNAYPQLKQWP